MAFRGGCDIPGNLRKKSSGKSSGVSEKDYERARKQVLRESQICFCGEAIDLKLAGGVCRYLDTSGWVVGVVYSGKCSDECDHPRKAHPWGPSADHVIPVDQLAPGDPLLTSVKNLRSCHVACNRRRGVGGKVEKPVYLTSKDHFL